MDAAARRYHLAVKVVRKWKAFAAVPLALLRAKSHHSKRLLRSFLSRILALREHRATSRAAWLHSESWWRLQALAPAFALLRSSAAERKGKREASKALLAQGIVWWAKAVERRAFRSIRENLQRAQEAKKGGGACNPKGNEAAAAAVWRRRRQLAGGWASLVKQRKLAAASALVAERHATRVQLEALHEWRRQAHALLALDEHCRRRALHNSLQAFRRFVAARLQTPLPAAATTTSPALCLSAGKAHHTLSLCSQALRKLWENALLQKRSKRVVDLLEKSPEAAAKRRVLAVFRARSTAASLARTEKQRRHQAACECALRWEWRRARRLLLYLASLALGKKALRASLGLADSHHHKRLGRDALFTWRLKHFGEVAYADAAAARAERSRPEESEESAAEAGGGGGGGGAEKQRRVPSSSSSVLQKRLAVTFRRSALQLRCFRAWHFWLSAHLQPGRRLNAMARLQGATTLLKHALRGWQRAVRRRLAVWRMPLPPPLAPLAHDDGIVQGEAGVNAAGSFLKDEEEDEGGEFLSSSKWRQQEKEEERGYKVARSRVAGRRRLATSVLRAVERYVHHRRQMDARRRLAVRHSFLHSRRRALYTLALFASSATARREREAKGLLPMAQGSTRRACRRWRTSVGELVGQRKQRDLQCQAAVAALSRLKLRRALLVHWEDFRLASVHRKLQTQTALHCFSRRLLRKCFEGWLRCLFNSQRRKAKVAASVGLWRRTLARKVFRKWVKVGRQQRLERRQFLAALVLWKEHRQRGAWRGLTAYVKSRRSKKEESLAALTLHRQALVLGGCRKWLCASGDRSSVRLSLASAAYEAKASRDIHIAAKYAHRWRAIVRARKQRWSLAGGGGSSGGGGRGGRSSRGSGNGGGGGSAAAAATAKNTAAKTAHGSLPASHFKAADCNIFHHHQSAPPHRQSYHHSAPPRSTLAPPLAPPLFPDQSFGLDGTVAGGISSISGPTVAGGSHPICQPSGDSGMRPTRKQQTPNKPYTPSPSSFSSYSTSSMAAAAAGGGTRAGGASTWLPTPPSRKRTAPRNPFLFASQAVSTAAATPQPPPPPPPLPPLPVGGYRHHHQHQQHDQQHHQQHNQHQQHPHPQQQQQQQQQWHDLGENSSISSGSSAHNTNMSVGREVSQENPHRRGINPGGGCCFHHASFPSSSHSGVPAAGGGEVVATTSAASTSAVATANSVDARSLSLARHALTQAINGGGDDDDDNDGGVERGALPSYHPVPRYDHSTSPHPNIETQQQQQQQQHTYQNLGQQGSNDLCIPELNTATLDEEILFGRPDKAYEGYEEHEDTEDPSREEEDQETDDQTGREITQIEEQLRFFQQRKEDWGRRLRAAKASLHLDTGGGGDGGDDGGGLEELKKQYSAWKGAVAPTVRALTRRIESLL